METIKIVIDYGGEIALNGEFTAIGPIEMDWFPDNNLIVETEDDRIVFNSIREQPSGGVYTIRPKKIQKQLQVLASEEKEIFGEKFKLELAKNDDRQYLTVTGKDGKRYACKLPK